MPLHIPTDTIHFHSISTGGNSAGDGGAGVNTGNISSTPTINFNPTNTAYGSEVNTHTGDHVDANSGILQSSGNHTGADTSTVAVDTTAYQTNFLAADMSQNVLAGIGGSGGSGNSADSGDVHVHT